MKTNKLFNNLKNRWPILLLLFVLITVAATSWVLGKYVANNPTDANVDIVAEGKVELSVTDNGDGSYTIKNTDASNIPAYVRFTVVVTWVSNDGDRVWGLSAQEGVDYIITDTNCTALPYGNYTYYYYKGTGDADEILALSEEFSFTVEKINTMGNYTMHIEVIADAIQCLPTTIAKSAWGVEFNSNTHTWRISETDQEGDA